MNSINLNSGQPEAVAVTSEMNIANDRHIKYLMGVIKSHGIAFSPMYTDGKLSVTVPEEILLGDSTEAIKEYCSNGQVLTAKLKGNLLFKEVHQNTLLIYQDRKVTVIGQINHVGRFFSKVIRPIKKEKKKNHDYGRDANLEIPVIEQFSRVGV